MGKMYHLKTLSVCETGKLIPRGDNLDSFRCRMHSENKVVDKNPSETVKGSDNVDVTHFRDAVGN